MLKRLYIYLTEPLPKHFSGGMEYLSPPSCRRTACQPIPR